MTSFLLLYIKPARVCIRALRRGALAVSAIALLVAFQSVSSEHANLPEGITPVMATWLWGHHTIPASTTKDGSPYWYAYPHTDPSVINDPPWTEVAAKHIKPGAKAPAVLFLHGCSGLIRGGVGYRVLLMSEGYAVFEPDAYARPGHSCDTSSIAKRTEEVGYALHEIRQLPWVDQDRVVLMGLSEGGRTVGGWEEPGFAAHVVISAPAFSRAPANVPVLAVAGAEDMYATAGYGQIDSNRTTTSEPDGISGGWATNWGMLTFVDEVNGEIRGKYAAEDELEGRILGSLEQGAFKGYWVESASQRKCDRPKDGSFYWGRVRFDFKGDFLEFSGDWSYCDKPLEMKNRWFGSRMTNRTTPSQSILIPGAGHDILGHPEFKAAIKSFLNECCQ